MSGDGEKSECCEIICNIEKFLKGRFVLAGRFYCNNYCGGIYIFFSCWRWDKRKYFRAISLANAYWKTEAQNEFKIVEK